MSPCWSFFRIATVFIRLYANLCSVRISLCSCCCFLRSIIRFCFIGLSLHLISLYIALLIFFFFFVFRRMYTNLCFVCISPCSFCCFRSLIRFCYIGLSLLLISLYVAVLIFFSRVSSLLTTPCVVVLVPVTYLSITLCPSACCLPLLVRLDGNGPSLPLRARTLGWVHRPRRRRRRMPLQVSPPRLVALPWIPGYFPSFPISVQFPFLVLWIVMTFLF